MKKQIKKFLALVLALMIVAGTFAPIKADAVGFKVGLNRKTIWLGQNEDWPISQYVNGISDSSIKSVVSKNKSIKVIYNKKSKVYKLRATKLGKSKIVVKYYEGRKLKSFSGVIKVKKYPAPVTSLKINGKGINVKKYNMTAKPIKLTKNGKIRVKMTLKDGWAIESVKDFFRNTLNYISPEYYENGKHISYEKDVTHNVRIGLTNTKTMELFDYTITIKPR